MIIVWLSIALGLWFAWSNAKNNNYAGVLVGVLLIGASFVTLIFEAFWPYWIVLSVALGLRFAGYDPYWGNK